MNNSPDLSTIISALSANPSAMGAITELLKNLGGSGSPSASPPPSEGARESEYPQFTAYTPHSPHSDNREQSGSGLSPELMGALLSALGSGSTRDRKPEDHIAPCDSCQGSVNKLLGSKTDSENRRCLLNALRPYLGEERRAKLDLLLKLLKVAELGKLSGFLNSV